MIPAHDRPRMRPESVGSRLEDRDHALRVFHRVVLDEQIVAAAVLEGERVGQGTDRADWGYA